MQKDQVQPEPRLKRPIGGWGEKKSWDRQEETEQMTLDERGGGGWEGWGEERGPGIGICVDVCVFKVLALLRKSSISFVCLL